jgi:outer membrane protein assembly factor BamB
MVDDASNLPVLLNEENLLWEIETGAKHQFPQPAIAGDLVLVGADIQGLPGPLWGPAVSRGGTFTAFDLRDGSVVWRLAVPQARYGPGTYGTCAPPIVQGDRVYIMSMYEVFCLDRDGLADGNQGMPAEEELALMTREPWELPEGETMPTELPDWAADIIWHFTLRDYNLTVQDATCSAMVDVAGQLWVSTANEIGSRSRVYGPHNNAPHMVVLDKETGKLIAEDDMDVPIVFHGEWSSPSLIEVNGKKAVIFPDGYGVLHAFEIPEPREDGDPQYLNEYWTFDLNPPEYRHLPDGREIVYTLDHRLTYKYPEGYYEEGSEKYFQFGDGLNRANKRRADGDHESILGPCEVISTPAVVGNRVYIGIGRDGYYGLSRGKGRFLCLELDDVTQPPRILWEDREIARTQSTASIHDGLVYIADGQGLLNCYDADTGEVKYRYDLDTPSIRERSQMVVDDKIYICEDHGTMIVLQTGPEPVLLGKSKLRKHIGTIDAVDGLIVGASHRRVFLWGDEAAVDRQIQTSRPDALGMAE